MKKRNRRILGLGLAMGMMLSMSISAFAREYSLDIPAGFTGSMRSTNLFQKSTSGAPYVWPDKVSISTTYFLSPVERSVILATDEKSLSGITKFTFTWKENYGGIGTSYCLSAYPTVVANYDAYNVTGTWSE